MTFPDRPQDRANAGTEACAACTLKEAITESLNTVFYGEALEVGAGQGARQTALAATGMPDDWWHGATLKGKKTLSDPISQGVDASRSASASTRCGRSTRPSGFATFAAGGIHRDPYFVAKVTDGDGQGAAAERRLRRPAGHAAGRRPRRHLRADRRGRRGRTTRWPAAGGRRARPVRRTWTHVDNTDAWMVGYTPSISAAVWMGSDAHQPIRNAAGQPIYGAGLPGQIWKTFMDTVLEGHARRRSCRARRSSPGTRARRSSRRRRRAPRRPPRPPPTGALDLGGADQRGRDDDGGDADHRRRPRSSSSSSSSSIVLAGRHHRLPDPAERAEHPAPRRRRGGAGERWRQRVPGATGGPTSRLHPGSRVGR